MTLSETHLAIARDLVVECLLHPAADAADTMDEGDEAGLVLRQASDLLERIGWPGSPRMAAMLDDDDTALIRTAALAALGAAAEIVDDASRTAGARPPGPWEADDAVAEIERVVALLDTIGWPVGSQRQAQPHPPLSDACATADMVNPLPVAAWTLDAAGIIVTCNPRARALGGDAGVGDHLAVLVAPHDRDRVRAAITDAAAEQRPLRCDAPLGEDGAPHRIGGAPRFGVTGRFTGYLVVAAPGGWRDTVADR